MEFDGTLGRHPRDYGWSERIENTEDWFMMRCSCKMLDINEFIIFFRILEEKKVYSLTPALKWMIPEVTVSAQRTFGGAQGS